MSEHKPVFISTTPVLASLDMARTVAFYARVLGAIDDVVRQAHSIGEASLHQRLPHPGTQDEIGRLVDTLNAMLDRLVDEGAQVHQRLLQFGVEGGGVVWDAHGWVSCPATSSPVSDPVSAPASSILSDKPAWSLAVSKNGGSLLSSMVISSVVSSWPFCPLGFSLASLFIHIGWFIQLSRPVAERETGPVERRVGLGGHQ